jgi:hypothetical protein
MLPRPVTSVPILLSGKSTNKGVCMIRVICCPFVGMIRVICCPFVGMIRVICCPSSETVYIDIILNKIIERKEK